MSDSLISEKGIPMAMTMTMAPPMKKFLASPALTLIKPLLFLLCLVPAARLGWGIWEDSLGANPIEFVTRALGTWAFNFLLITLAITPLRRLTGWHGVLRLRRMLGLYAFFYALLHLTAYLWLDQFFDWEAIAKDILKRPFITAGMAAFALLVPLAATSHNALIRRLGGKRWQSLHRSVYAIALIACVHYAWLVKKDLHLPILYGMLVAVLLGLRAFWRYQEWLRQQQAARPVRRGRVIPIVPSVR